MVDVQVLNFGEDDGGLDPDSLDPAFHYRFVQNRPQRMIRARKQGYKPVSRTDDGVVLLSGSDADESPDDLIREGDRILMKVPKNLKNARRKQLKKLEQSRMKAPKSGFKRKAKTVSQQTGHKVPVTTADKENGI